MELTKLPEGLERSIADAGITARRLLPALEAAAEGVTDLASLVQRSGLPRRTIEALLAVDAPAAAMRAAANRLAPPRGPLGPARVRRMAHLIADGPPPRSGLDHVPATPETAVRRADWLLQEYDLSGRRLVLIGDHDLTSLAAAPALPDTDIVVVDIDERLLDYVDEVARRQHLRITCVYADLTDGLPDTVRGVAHVVFTDPPYTPEGVALFLARGVQAVVTDQPSRILLAYGFSPMHPALGVQVQRRINALELAIESIERGFNAYDGAQAIGSRADLYTLVATAGSRRAAQRAAANSRRAIYTHGPRSVESAPATSPDERHTSLLDGDESWLGRRLITTTDASPSFLVPNSHPDIANAEGQARLARLVRGKFELEFRRSQPDRHTAVVVGNRRTASSPGVEAGRVLLDRPQAALAPAVADALYKGSRAGSEAWAKSRAREMGAQIVAGAGGHYGAHAVASLPRRVLLAVLDDLERALDGRDRA